MLPVLAMICAQMLLFELAPTIFATPLQLNLPTLPGSALLTTTTPAIINTTFLNESPCFAPLADRHATNYRDCASAATEMTIGMDAQVYTFGRGSRATYKLPKTFYSGTCAVTLDMIYEDQIDRLSFETIQDATFRLALRCTSGPVFDVGGVAAVGPRKLLHVTILGIGPRSIHV